MAQLQTDKEIITALGGPTAFASIGYTEHAVKKWMQRGIAWSARAKVLKLAKQQNKRLPKDFQEQRVAF